MATKVPDYTEFDKMLMAYIELGGKTASALTIHLEAEAKPLMNRPGEEFRVVDRRLQALRKKGRISFERRGGSVVWRITKGGG